MYYLIQDICYFILPTRTMKTKEKYEARITHLKYTTGNKNNSYY